MSKDSDTAVKKSLKNFERDFIKTGREVFEEKCRLKSLSISPSLDFALNGGLLEGTWVQIVGKAKTGKAQPLGSIVYTPSGPVKMRDIKQGDKVCTPDGKSAKILKIYPQGVKEVYKVTFNDNTSAFCCKDHLWKVAKNNGKNEYVVLSLEEILRKGLKYHDRNKWKIQLTEPVKFNRRQLGVKPYILGCLIGDGGLTHGTPMISSADEEILDEFRSYCDSIGAKLIHRSNYDYAISYGADHKKKENQLTKELRNLKLMGCNSHQKFIPEDYKYSDYLDRLDLARGLMDTDGFNDKGKTGEYTTVSKQLSKDVMELLQSLGYKVKIKMRETKCDGKSFLSYRLHIAGNDISNIFSLTRKKFDKKRIKPKLFRSIKSVEQVASEECQCIELDSKDHLYLTDNFIVTHNTSTILQIAANAQAEGRNVVYLDAEGRIKKYNLCGVKGLDLDKIQLIQSDGNTILTAEMFLNALEEKIKAPENEGALFIIDSLSSLIPAKELEGYVSGDFRPGLPKILSNFCKRMGQVVPKTKAIIIGIHHLISTQSSMPGAKQWTADGGVKIGYQYDTMMQVSHSKDWIDDNGNRIGQEINWKILTSSQGTDKTNAISYFRFNHGLDNVEEIVALGDDFGIFNKKGAWYYMNFLENYKEEIGEQMLLDLQEKKYGFQGKAKLCSFLNDNPSVVKVIEKEMKEFLV